MPVIKSAKKKLRQDRKRENQNQAVKNELKLFIKTAKNEKSEKAIITAVKIADKAAKKGIIHKNKAARLKSRLAKLLKADEATTVKKTETKAKKSTTATA